MTLSLKTFSLDWQKTNAPGHTQAKVVESSQQAFTRFIQDVMSPSEQVTTRAYQINTLLQLASIYVFMASEAYTSLPIMEMYNFQGQIQSLDKSLATSPVKDPTLLPKWRFLKAAMQKEEFMAPYLVKRHALSMALILQRSLDTPI